MSDTIWAPSVTTTLIGLLTCLVALICITGNILALRYFLAHRKTTSALSYIFLSSNDTITLLLLAPVQLSLIKGSSQLALGRAECNTWAVAWCVTRRLNNFIVMWVLACRTVSLMSHFKYVRIVNICIHMLSYSLLLLLQGLVPVMKNGSYTVDPTIGVCDWTYNVIAVGNSSAARVTMVTVDVMQFGGPLIADIVMTVSAVVVIKSGDQILGKVHISSSVSTKTKVTMTILMLGTCHVILNIPQLVHVIMFHSANYRIWDPTLIVSDHSLKVLTILVFPLLNCVSNILIYYTRMTTLRLQVFQLLTLFRIYWDHLTDCIKYLCHENNRVVPSTSDQSENGTGRRFEGARQVKCLQLSELIDSDLASEEKKRYVDYLYQGEDEGDKISRS